MALKVELKPNERIIIGTAVIKNGEQRTRFFVEGHAAILREKDILTPTTANSPAKLIYLSIQLMYLDGTVEKQQAGFFELVNEFIEAAPSATHLIAEINNRIVSGEFYKALKVAKDLIAYEQSLIDNAKRSSGLFQNAAANFEPAGT
jgi:flagellar biosynthesis repressor protein FlbT